MTRIWPLVLILIATLASAGDKPTDCVTAKEVARIVKESCSFTCAPTLSCDVPPVTFPSYAWCRDPVDAAGHCPRIHRRRARLVPIVE